MRIIGGRFKGMQLKPPGHLPVRPTTDRAKEALFTILSNNIDFDGLIALDLFSGTGNIALELVSRGCEKVVAADNSVECCKYLQKLKKEKEINNLEIIKKNIFDFLKEKSEISYDIIFADPPYDTNNLHTIAGMVFENSWIEPQGILVIEHQSMIKLPDNKNFLQSRVYGKSAFSFFSRYPLKAGIIH